MIQETNTGKYGAKVQSWKKHGPREILENLINKFGSEDKAFLLKEYSAAVRKNPEALHTIILYTFTNNYRSLVEDNEGESERRRKKYERRIRTKRDAEVAVKVARVRVVTLVLGMTMPNGKTLGESTGREVRKVGGLFSKIAAKVPPNKRVDSVLSEKEALALWRSQ